MSIARPDTSQRREPTRPGRCFGTGAIRTCSRAGLAVLSSAVLLATPFTVAMADGDNEPISLSNADVDRLHTGQNSPAATAPATDAQGPTDAEIAEQQATLEADLRRQLDQISRKSMGAVARTLDERAVPSTPDVSARPLHTAPAAMPAAPAPRTDLDDADAGDAESEPNASLLDEKRATRTPACMYGSRGQLLHSPKGRYCKAVRQESAAKTIRSESTASASTTSTDKKKVGCVYGSRGQLLYASPGVECAG